MRSPIQETSRHRIPARVSVPLVLAGLAMVNGCAGLRPLSSAAVVLDIPAVRQPPDRCGPAMLTTVYRYGGLEADEVEVAARIFNPSAGGTLPGMLVADARGHGWRAAFGPGKPADWERALAWRVPVICLQSAATAAHFVVLQGHDRGRFLVNDGSGRLLWRKARDLAGPKTLSIYVWPGDSGFDPSPLPSHDQP